MKKSREIPVHSILFSNYWKYWCDFEIKSPLVCSVPWGCSACVNILKVLCPAGRNSLILFSLFSLVCNHFPHVLSAVSLNFCEQNSWKACALVWKGSGVSFDCLLCGGFQVYSRSKRFPRHWVRNQWGAIMFCYMYIHTYKYMHICMYTCMHTHTAI